MLVACCFVQMACCFHYNFFSFASPPTSAPHHRRCHCHLFSFHYIENQVFNVLCRNEKQWIIFGLSFLFCISTEWASYGCVRFSSVRKNQAISMESDVEIIGVVINNWGPITVWVGSPESYLYGFIIGLRTLWNPT